MTGLPFLLGLAQECCLRYGDSSDEMRVLRSARKLRPGLAADAMPTPSFTPVIGAVSPTRVGPRHYRFEARDADSTNTGGYLVNCQWDFDYQRGHFAADSKYILGRVELKGKDAKAAGRKFEAVLNAEHTFEKIGTWTIACRVQDNLGAETIRSITLEVS